MEASSMAAIDPETLFLASKRQTGNEWELYKENARPLKRGRSVHLLNEALRSHTDNSLKKSLRETRRRLIEAIDEYKGEDPLQPWLDIPVSLSVTASPITDFLCSSCRKLGS